MKTGEAAKILGVDPKTVRNWIDDYGLTRFFSASATGTDGSFQRILSESDLLVLNTVRALKGRDVYDWEAIAEFLETGEREREFPQNAISGDPRTIPVEQAQQSARAMATMAERDGAISKVREMATRIEDLEEKLEQTQREKDAIKELLLREIGDLQRQIGKLEGQMEVYKSQDN